MVLLYGNLESIEGKEGVIKFPKGTLLYGSPNGDLVIKTSKAIHGMPKDECILTNVKKFFATKDRRSWWSGERFKHNFKGEVDLYAGSGEKLMILHSKRRLWKIFDYGTISEEEYQQLRQRGVEISI